MAQSQQSDNPGQIFVFEYAETDDEDLKTGEISARDEADAKRQLRVKFRTPNLPHNLILRAKDEVERGRSALMRGLLHVLAAHHRWIVEGKGARAELAGAPLSNMALHGRNLSFANLNEADLVRADLRDSNLYGATLRSARLRDTDLRGADLRHADLSEADLRGANLLDANLKGVELWRANLQGATILPKQLHAALRCKGR